MVNVPKPKPFDFGKLKNRILNIAQTSHYQVWITPTPSVLGWMKEKADAIEFKEVLGDVSALYEDLIINCSEASLPGSTFFTHDVNVYNGVSEKFAYMRSYDDRADFTFYVNVNYMPIKFFELWMSYIADESYAKTERGGIDSEQYNYRMNFPENYRQEITITKFERSYAGLNNKNTPANAKDAQKTAMTYVFKSAYPISMNSIPVSYDGGDALKCTVSFTYTRYYIKTDKMNTIETTSTTPTTNEPQQPVVGGQPATAENYGTDFGGLA